MDAQLNRYSVHICYTCLAVCNFRIQTNLFYGAFSVCDLDICGSDNCTLMVVYLYLRAFVLSVHAAGNPGYSQKGRLHI